jgi:hypothetical protein
MSKEISHPIPILSTIEFEYETLDNTYVIGTGSIRTINKSKDNNIYYGVYMDSAKQAKNKIIYSNYSSPTYLVTVNKNDIKKIITKTDYIGNDLAEYYSLKNMGGQNANRAENPTKRKPEDIAENPFVVVKELFYSSTKK